MKKWTWEKVHISSKDLSRQRCLVSTGEHEDGTICETILRHEARWDITESDAHLIAAAPELYEALALLLSFHESVGSPSPARPCEMARAALAKARGEDCDGTDS